MRQSKILALFLVGSCLTSIGTVSYVVDNTRQINMERLEEHRELTEEYQRIQLDIAKLRAELTHLEEEIHIKTQSMYEVKDYLESLPFEPRPVVSRGTTKRIIIDYSNINNISNISIRELNAKLENTNLANTGEYFIKILGLSLLYHIFN